MKTVIIFEVKEQENNEREKITEENLKAVNVIANSVSRELRSDKDDIKYYLD